MKNFTKNIFTIFAILLANGLFANHLSGKLLFSTRLSGANEVPAVSTDATGVGSFFLNETRDTLCITVTTVGLSGSIAGAHIHQGFPGTNGGVLIGFTDNVDGNSISATVTGDDITAELLEMMLAGELYFNIHTALNPSGEIRGQIALETDRAFHAVLNGDQENPPVVTDASGIAIFNLSKTGMMVNYNVVVSGLSGPITGAHLHLAPAGQNGNVVVNLTNDVNGNVISGQFDPTTVTGLVDDMLAGNIYINVHTDENQGGEIRGQLKFDSKLSMDAVINTDQEIPAPTGSSANGLGWASLNYTMDTLFYRIQLDGLSGPVTGAHFHDGEFGTTGGVLIAMTDDVDGNVINGFTTGEALSTENINKFLSGGIYINVHTDLNASGEVRGQVYKAAREGYTVNLSGDQEVPAVETDATGSGIVSIDRDQSNAHFMIAYNDLSGPQTMAHFHAAPAGTNGGVIFTLSSFFEQTNIYDAAFGYWTNMDDVPFDAAAALAFREGNVYVNIHSSDVPSGEIRGQVTRESICSQGSVGIFEIPKKAALNVYPNPSSDIVNVDLTTVPVGNYQMVISDITGKVVQNKTVNSSSQKQLSLSISDLNSGIYILSVFGDITTFSARLIKE